MAADDRFDTPVAERVLAPGEARCPGPSTRDLILADGWATPPALTEQSYRFLGDADLPYERYTSPVVFELEMKRLWPKVWQWACREEHIPDVGDHITYDVGPYSILIVRSAPDEIKAYPNACLHRGTQLKPSDSRGFAPRLRCPFHGWTWSLGGDLESLPCRWDFPHVTDEAYRLPTVRLERWGGFVFVNLDPDATPLAEHLGVLSEHFKDGWDLSNRHIVLHLQKELATNWKAAQEAFLEAYHVVATHAQALPTAGDANAQYDLFGDHVSRFVHTVGHPSPHYRHAQTQQEILDKMRGAPDGTVVPAGRLARSVAAEHLRASLGEQWGVDLSRYSDSEMLDSIEYHLFPNMCLFPGVSLPMIYRFRPMAMDPGRTVFDLIFLQPNRPGETVPRAPDPIRIREDQSYAEAPGMSPGLGFVYDQDTDNLAMQYKGFQASTKPGETLGNYQEARIRHFHQALDAFLARAPA
jgi:phenylpropionate dioxygenase-like ring-hydroxylating dioxygenase large terminal subunit